MLQSKRAIIPSNVWNELYGIYMMPIHTCIYSFICYYMISDGFFSPSCKIFRIWTALISLDKMIGLASFNSIYVSSVRIKRQKPRWNFSCITRQVSKVRMKSTIAHTSNAKFSPSKKENSIPSFWQWALHHPIYLLPAV